MKNLQIRLLILATSIVLSACGNAPTSGLILESGEATTQSDATLDLETTPRPAYAPGTLVEYFAQTGDTVGALAGRFNTSAAEIMAANPIIPVNVTTLPAGLPMEIPIYYRAFWGSQYLIIPDGHFPNGPYQRDFASQEFIESHEGWLSNYSGTAAKEVLNAGAMVDLVATNFSISPRVLLALLEERAEGLSDPEAPDADAYVLGYDRVFYEGLYLQLVWAANTLNNGYYGWRGGKLIEFDLLDGSIYRPDPWQNASSVALQYFYAQILPADEFKQAISSEGFAKVYEELYGDAWQQSADHIPGSLVQPELRLPFVSGESWSLTGGPHTGWGEGEPWAAIDFAPGANTSGCVQSQEWVTAVADGLVVRTGEGTVVLDLDRDGDERTGWVIFYLHIEERARVREGGMVLAGQPIGHPSCEGGSSTGTHQHIARKYNGEWILASGDMPFVMEGWEVVEGDVPYEGTLTKPGRQVIACRCSDANTRITSLAEPVNFPTPSTFDLALPTATPSP